ncbi:hypothetical protein FRC17_004790 [Serendipita sp. 399]|nr:hypothetical protein FRC17_004790 [Serendipita sp. 399]
MIIKFVRHGETDANRQKILQGQLDTQLNSLGRQQAEAVGIALRNDPFTHAFSSDLERAKDTAAAILQYHEVSLTLMQTLREKSFGDAEGHPWGTRVRTGGETPGQFRKRVMGWWKENVPILLASESVDGDPYVLVVGHGAFIRTMLDGLLSERGFSFQASVGIGKIPNTGISTVHVDAVNQGAILSCGDDTHLKSGKDDIINQESLQESVDELALVNNV